VNRLRALVDVAGGMLEAMSAEDRLAGLVASYLSDRFDQVSVWLVPAGGGPLLVEVAGHDRPVVDRITQLVEVRPGDPHPSLVAGQPVIVGDEPDFGGGLCLVPMIAHGRLLGVVGATVPAGTPMIADADLEFAVTLADMAAVTLVNSRLLADATAVTEDLRRQVELLDDISDAMIGLDADRRVVSWNAGAERVYGYPQSEALGCDLFSLLATQFYGSDGRQLPLAEVCESAITGEAWHGEARERRADAVPLTVLSSLNATVGDDGTLRGFVLVNRDVTDQRREEHRAMHDALTGLPNHCMLTNRLYDSFARACRNGTPLAVLYVDLLGFKATNDRYGREVGDEVLRATGRRLVATLRDSDTVARVEGDSFVIVLEKAGTDDNVSMVAERIARALAEPVEVGDERLEVPATVGAAAVTGAEGLNTDPERLIELADAARHMAKAAGVPFILEHLAPLNV
jgi:diguanylate cyclase (GGDEF)-like protein/PAS domain S-box-containing protein